MAKRKLFPVVRWMDEDGDIKQCLNECPGSDYNTFCGMDLHDTGYVVKEGTKLEYKKGYVTCGNCLGLIDTVLKYYPERKSTK